MLADLTVTRGSKRKPSPISTLLELQESLARLNSLLLWSHPSHLGSQQTKAFSFFISIKSRLGNWGQYSFQDKLLQPSLHQTYLHQYSYQQMNLQDCYQHCCQNPGSNPKI